MTVIGDAHVRVRVRADRSGIARPVAAPHARPGHRCRRQPILGSAVTELADENATYRYRYTGLKLLFRSQHNYFLRLSDPTDTRNTLGMSLSAALNAPIVRAPGGTMPAMSWCMALIATARPP